MSALSASAISASTSPVAGFGVVKVLPDSASIHCPSIKSWYLRGVFASAGCADIIYQSSVILDKSGICVRRAHQHLAHPWTTIVRMSDILFDGRRLGDTVAARNRSC